MVFCIPKQSLVKARHAPPELQLPLVLLQLPLVVLPREVIGLLYPQTEPRRGPPALPGALGCLETLATVPHGRGGRGTAAPDLLGGGLWGGSPRGLPGVVLESWGGSRGPFGTGGASLEPGRPRGPFAGGPAGGSRMGVRGGPLEGPRGAVSRPSLVRLARGTARWNRAGLGDPFPGVPRRGSAWGSAGGPWGPCARPVDLLFSGELCPAVPSPLGMDQGPPPGSPARGRAPPCGRGAPLHPPVVICCFQLGNFVLWNPGPEHGHGALAWVPCPGEGAALWPRGATAPATATCWLRRGSARLLALATCTTLDT